MFSVLIDRITTNTTARGLWPYNGQLALVQEALRSYNYTHLFADLYRSGELIDPVIGMRLDPVNPRLTVGAIDPEDYEGVGNIAPRSAPAHVLRQRRLCWISALTWISVLVGSDPGSGACAARVG